MDAENHFAKIKELVLSIQLEKQYTKDEILEMYMPLINKHSYIDGAIDEDLRQIILMKIIKNIGKFKVR